MRTRHYLFAAGLVFPGRLHHQTRMGSFQIELWVLVSVAAACFQTLRFMLQKVLAQTKLSSTGATFARFVYSAPLVVLFMAVYVQQTSAPLVFASLKFWGFAAAGGLSQVLATICVVSLFKTRNFAVGVTLRKTEVLLAALIGFLLLGDTITLASLAAMVAGLVGMLLLAASPDVKKMGWHLLWNRSIGLGLSAGALFAVSSVCYRGASLEVVSEDPVLRAGITLGVVTSMQLVGMTLWLSWRDAMEIKRVWQARKLAVWIGLLSLCGSACWFLAFTLQQAAYVKAVGQIELVLSLLVSVLVFGERSTGRELLGIAVLSSSIIALVMVT